MEHFQACIAFISPTPRLDEYKMQKPANTPIYLFVPNMKASFEWRTNFYS